jgi:hypothetical protein
LGGLALGAALGPAFAVAGVIVTLLSARAWLAAAVDESDQARSLERGLTGGEADIAEPAAPSAPPAPPPAHR